MDLPEATASDERRHEPDGDQLWNESYYLDFFAADGSLGGYLRLGLYPNMDVAWYWACVVGRRRPLVTVIDNAAPLPTSPGSLEIRADGLWCDHNIGTPLEHMSIGLEAFGVTLDKPADVYRGAYGDRTALGFDLEWETDGNVFRYPEFFPRYEIPCRVHGQILVGAEEIAFDGFGQRDHSWGRRDWWTMGWCWTAFRMEDGARFHAVTSKPDQGFSFGYDQEPPAGTDVGPPLDTMVVTSFVADEVLGVDGLPLSARLTVNERVFDVAPIAWSPVLLTSPDNREARFPRGMCTFTEIGGDQDGRRGVGWIEFNQPQTPA